MRKPSLPDGKKRQTTKNTKPGSTRKTRSSSAGKKVPVKAAKAVAGNDSKSNQARPAKPTPKKPPPVKETKTIKEKVVKKPPQPVPQPPPKKKVPVKKAAKRPAKMPEKKVEVKKAAKKSSKPKEIKPPEPVVEDHVVIQVRNARGKPQKSAVSSGKVEKKKSLKVKVKEVKAKTPPKKEALKKSLKDKTESIVNIVELAVVATKKPPKSKESKKKSITGPPIQIVELIKQEIISEPETELQKPPSPKPKAKTKPKPKAPKPKKEKEAKKDAGKGKGVKKEPKAKKESKKKSPSKKADIKKEETEEKKVPEEVEPPRKEAEPKGSQISLFPVVKLEEPKIGDEKETKSKKNLVKKPKAKKKKGEASQTKKKLPKKKKAKGSESPSKSEKSSDSERARRMKLFGFWNGPKKHRVASLNALAKVHCLYENESRGAINEVLENSVLPKKPDKVDKVEKVVKPKEEGATSSNPRCSLRSAPGLRSVGRHLDIMQALSTTSSSDEHSDSGADRKGRLIELPSKKSSVHSETSDDDAKKKEEPRKRKRRKRSELMMDLKDMVVRKRMASLNASAMLAATYSVEKKPAKPDDEGRKKKSSKTSAESTPSMDVGDTTEDEVIVSGTSKKLALIVTQDADVSIRGVFLNSTTRSTRHEGFCSIAGMQYRISSTSHTQTETTAVSTETVIHSDHAAVEGPSPPCKSYTPLGALSSMQPPGDPTPRRHPCPTSAFSAPYHQHQEIHGYYQPAGPLITHQGPAPILGTSTSSGNSVASAGGSKSSSSPGPAIDPPPEPTYRPPYPPPPQYHPPYTPYQYLQPPPQYHQDCYTAGYYHKYPTYARRYYFPQQEYPGPLPQGPPPPMVSSPPESYPPPPPPPQASLVDPYPPPPHPNYYYPAPPPPPPPTAPCFSHPPQPRALPFMDPAYQSCPCPIQSFPKNVHTGPLTGSSKGSEHISSQGGVAKPLPPVALALPLEPTGAVGPPSPARGSAGMPHPPSPALATARNPPSQWSTPPPLEQAAAGLLTTTRKQENVVRLEDDAPPRKRRRSSTSSPPPPVLELQEPLPPPQTAPENLTVDRTVSTVCQEIPSNTKPIRDPTPPPPTRKKEKKRKLECENVEPNLPKKQRSRSNVRVSISESVKDATTRRSKERPPLLMKKKTEEKPVVEDKTKKIDVKPKKKTKVTKTTTQKNHVKNGKGKEVVKCNGTKKTLEEETITLELILGPRRTNPSLKWSNGWSWEGEPYTSKVFLTTDECSVVRRCYPSMRHIEGDVIRPRDCVLLRSGPRKHLPFVAKVAAMWENPEDGEMMLSLLWYYRPEHTEAGRLPWHPQDEIFASRHKDTNSVACIEDKCFVLTFNEYCRYKATVRVQDEGLRSSQVNRIVPPTEEEYYRADRQPPGRVAPDMIFYCRRVYDFRQKRILKHFPVNNSSHQPSR